MRISTGRGWLAVAALALGTARAQGDHVVFTPEDFTTYKNPDEPAILLRSEAGIRTFHWIASNVVVDEVRLFASTNGLADEIVVGYGKRAGEPTGIGGGLAEPNKVATSSVSHPTFPSGGPRGGRHGTEEPVTEDIGGIGRRNPQNIGDVTPADVPAQHAQLLVYSSETGGQVSFSNLETVAEGSSLFFEATWADGQSYSRAFTMFNTFEGVPYSQAHESQDYFNLAPARPESGTPVPGANDEIPDTAGETPSQGTQGSANGGKLPTPGDDTAEDGSAEGSPGGLSQGAIIGIAVGCGVVGLLIIAALVWYLLRRRQQKKALLPVDSAYSSANRADELMAEKEANADVDVSPHSPYSDDGASGGGGGGAGPSGAYQGGGEAVAAGAAGGAASFSSRQHLQDPPRSFTPYSDRPSAGAGAGGAVGAGTPSVRAASLAQTDEARASVPSPIPGRATPRGLTTPYAHLVEEGMTEEEIRRLEEEERQLDAAIEQAGRR